MRNESVGLILLFVLSLYGAVSASWYSPSGHYSSAPAVVFAVFPVMGALGVIFLALRKGAV